MSTTRRDFMAAAVTAAGVTATHDLAHAEGHDHQAVPSDPALRTKSLESLLVEKGLVDPAALDVIVEAYEHKVGPRNGARVIARAWVEPGYKQRLLADGSAALKELGYGGAQGEDTLVVENTPRTDRAELETRKEAWADAYRHTPDGKPVELAVASRIAGDIE
jgi:hypothetical protein